MIWALCTSGLNEATEWRSPASPRAREYRAPVDMIVTEAWKADTAGNLVFRLTQRNFNPLMAMAATVTIVEVENDIVEAGELDPDLIHVAGIYVDRLVRIPEDGIWV